MIKKSIIAIDKMGGLLADKNTFIENGMYKESARRHVRKLLLSIADINSLLNNRLTDFVPEYKTLCNLKAKRESLYEDIWKIYAEYHNITDQESKGNMTTEERYQEHLNREGQHLEFHDKVTYIEQQNITVQAGANFYNGSKPSTTEQVHISPVMAFAQVVETLIDDRIIVSKQDFSILYKLDEEMCLLGSLNMQGFANRICELDCVPENLKPNIDSIKSTSFGSKIYPDWDFTGLKTKISHIRAVANGYIREMKNRGYCHISLSETT